SAGDRPGPTIPRARVPHRASVMLPRTVSVVIPCFNQGRFLDQAVRSVLEQDYPATEVIVVNDGATDDTAGSAGAFGNGTRSREHPNRGRPAARNAGIMVGSGEYIAFLDADDVLLPGSLSTRATFLDTHPAVALVCGTCVVFDESGPLDAQSRWSRRPR